MGCKIEMNLIQATEPGKVGNFRRMLDFRSQTDRKNQSKLATLWKGQDYALRCPPSACKEGWRPTSLSGSSSILASPCVLPGVEDGRRAGTSRERMIQGCCHSAAIF